PGASVQGRRQAPLSPPFGPAGEVHVAVTPQFKTENRESKIPSLPHLLEPGLRLVFIGYNPAIYSAEAGHYYARPGNMFWRQLSASGLAGREVWPTDDRLLPDEAGIGFTD